MLTAPDGHARPAAGHGGDGEYVNGGDEVEINGNTDNSQSSSHSGSGTQNHVEMLHRLAVAVPGEDNVLVLSGYGQDPDKADEPDKGNFRPFNLHFKVGDVDGTLAAIQARQDERHRNLYMPLAVYGPGLRPHAKGSEAEIIAVLGLVVDFDDEATAHMWRELLPLPPDYVINSSKDRFQCFYLFAEPVDMVTAKAIAQRLKLYTKGDHCSSDMCHVWRLPGCLNWPNAKKVRAGRNREPQMVKVALPWTGSQTRLEDLDAVLPSLAVAVPKSKPVRVGVEIDDFDEDHDFDVSSFLHGLPNAVKNKIKAKPGANSDRSADIYAVVQSLLKKNLTDAQIGMVIMAFPEGIGHKYVGRSDLMTEIARIRTKPPTSPDLVLSSSGQPVAQLVNARILLRRKQWAGVLKYNEFANRIEIHRQGPVDFSIADHVDGVLVWNDTCDTLTAEWMQHQGVGVKSSLVAEAVEVTAKENTYHPVREYLDGLHWDGCPRLDSWAVQFLGAADGPYVRAVSAKWMIGAAARIYDPGCKMDYALILEGPQGLGKSQALRVLGGDYFSDELGDIKNKDTLLKLHSGLWLIEMGELDSLTRSEVNAFKQFVSSQTDHFRPPYGRRARNHRRSCVFGGSTNENEYLRDATGGRRFWPITCTKIDVEGLQAVRDQLWAEAADRYRNGERCYLDRVTEKLAQTEQRARYQSDEWEDRVLTYAEKLENVTTEAVLRSALGMWEPRDQGNRAYTMRVGKILRSNGWKLNTSIRPRCYERPQSANLTEVGGEVGGEKVL